MQGGESISKKLRPLGYEPTKHITYYNSYNVNDFKFYTQRYGYYKSTMNSSVYIKGSWWEEVESGYYKIFKKVIKLTYFRGNSVILFKCR